MSASTTQAPRRSKALAIVAPPIGFTVDAKQLAVGLGHITRATKLAGGGLAILSSVHVTIFDDHVVLVGTDLAIDITVTIPAQGNAGVVLVNAKMLESLAAKFDGPFTVTVTPDGDAVTIDADGYHGTIRTQSANDYPHLAEVTGEVVTVDSVAFRNAVKRTIIAVSTDTARPILKSVLFESEGDRLRLTATDSYRLAVATVTEAPISDGPLLVPHVLLECVMRAIGDDDTIDITVTDRTITFTTSTVQLRGRLVDGDFPNYRQLIPTELTSFARLDREALITAITRCSIITGKGALVVLSIHDSGAAVSSAAADVGHGAQPVAGELEGPAVVVSFNSDYLLAGLRTFESEVVTLSIVDALKPCTLTADGEAGLYLAMPVRTS